MSSIFDEFDKEAQQAREQKKRERESKDERRSEKEVLVTPKNPIWPKLCICLVIFLVLSVTLKCLPNFIDMTVVFPYIGIIDPYLSYAIIILSVLLLLVWFFFLKRPVFDSWVLTIAHRRLGTQKVYYTRKRLYISYDVTLNRKDIKEFITEISDKSNKWTYFLQKLDIDNYYFSMTISKKQEIPKRCVINKSTDTVWNFIPMGEARNDKTKKVSVIGWYLNDNKARPEAIESLPSTSLLIAGGTGSGKSVVENGIIGHITRHAEHIQGLLADVKKVEFGGLEGYNGIKAVALSVAEVEEILSQARAIMMDRFGFMQENHVNNVYKLKTQVDWYEINGKRYQFDEIFSCRINGKPVVTTIDKIMREVNDGADVEIDDRFLS